MSARPNELGNEVRPNVLSPGGGRPRPEAPAETAHAPRLIPSPGPNRNLVPDAVPGAGTRSAGASRPARTGRRSFGIWIVLAVIALNVFRAFAGRISSDTGPTNQPLPTEVGGGVVQPFPTPDIDPSTPAGQIEFGTSIASGCTIEDPAASFTTGTAIWWSAEFNVSLPGSARVLWQMFKNDKPFERTTYRDPSRTADWNVLCPQDLLVYQEVGKYRLVILDDSEQVVLAKGSFELVASP
jgi:hypothetical protein